MSWGVIVSSPVMDAKLGRVVGIRVPGIMVRKRSCVVSEFKRKQEVYLPLETPNDFDLLGTI